MASTNSNHFSKSMDNSHPELPAVDWKEATFNWDKDEHYEFGRKLIQSMRESGYMKE